MVMQIIPAAKRKPSFGERINASLATAAQYAGKYAEQSQERELQEKENKALDKQIGLNLSGIRDPETRQRLIADQLAYGRKSKQAEATKNIDYSLGELEGDRKFSKELPDFIGKSAKEPVASKAIGNAPQPETAGIKRPVFTPDEILEKGRRIAQDTRASGSPMSDLEGFNIANQMNEANKNYNQSVDQDQQRKIEAQRQYGDVYLSELNKVMPDANPEIQAMIMKRGEEASAELGSEADIKRTGAVEARKLKNAVANVRNMLPAKRLVSGIKETLLGTSRDFEKRKNDIRTKLDPLLKEGLYDTARNLLSEKGYHPEEREAIISDLGEGSKKVISQMPNLKKNVGAKGVLQGVGLGAINFLLPNDQNRSEKDTQIISNSIRSAVQAEPTANMILLRKAYEDKGVDWQEFKDVVNDMIINGQLKLTDDQFNQLDTLDTPPLDNLDKLLHGLNLIGR